MCGIRDNNLGPLFPVFCMECMDDEHACKFAMGTGSRLKVITPNSTMTRLMTVARTGL